MLYDKSLDDDPSCETIMHVAWMDKNENYIFLCNDLCYVHP
jgi:hypothetical protein